MKSQVLRTVLCYISCWAAGEIWDWSLLGVKGLGRASPPLLKHRDSRTLNSPCRHAARRLYTILIPQISVHEYYVEACTALIRPPVQLSFSSVTLPCKLLSLFSWQYFRGLPVPDELFAAVAVEAKIDYNKGSEVGKSHWQNWVALPVSRASKLNRLLCSPPELSLRQGEEVLVVGFTAPSCSWKPVRTFGQ